MWPADRPADARSDRRPGDDPAGGNPVPGSGAGGAGSERGVRAAVQGPGLEGVRPGPGGRRRARPVRADPTRPVLQARHRCGGRQAGGSVGYPAAGGGRRRDRPRADGGIGRPGRADRGKGRDRHVLGETGLYVRRAVFRRAGPAELLLQLAVRRLPVLRWAGDSAGGRSGAGRPGPRPVDPGGRPGALERYPAGILEPRAGRPGRGARVLARHAVAPARVAGQGRGALRLRQGHLRPVPQQVRTAAGVLDDVRRNHPQRRAPAPGDGLRLRAGEVRAVHAGGAVPGVQGGPAAA
jgi:hypothetical protein